MSYTPGIDLAAAERSYPKALRLAIDAMALGHAASAKAVVMHDVVMKHGEEAVEFVKEVAARVASALKR